MKIAYNWLKKYINPLPSITETSILLTNVGLEVEAVELYESQKGGFKGLVVGEVRTKEKHPNADRLNVTTVDIGTGELLQIVCGAPNVEAGQKVIVATIGTLLYPETGESFVIKASKIRSVDSQGMICAEDEIGLGKSHDGILVLPPTTPIGMLVSEYFEVSTDSVFEIGLTPNHVEAASHYGTARDLFAALQLQNKETTLQSPIYKNIPTTGDCPIKIQIENVSLCPRYAGLVIENIVVKASPLWLQNKLKSIGVRPINNIVDCTNFVLHELGQPLHAFDKNKIKGNILKVRTASPNEELITLDSQKRQLQNTDVIIANETDAMCLAGVFGGLDSGVTEHTTSIFLESAYFDAGSIRKSARYHQLNTDSSYRFERGTDPNTVVVALQRVADLILETAGGNIVGDIVDFYPTPILPKEIVVSYERILALIGFAIPIRTIQEILQNLQIKITIATDTHLTLSIPTFKVDVHTTEDIVEEIIRIYGYNNIPLPTSFSISTNNVAENPAITQKSAISNFWVNNGFQEAMNNSLTNATYYEGLEGFDPTNNALLANSLSNELTMMRRTLLFGLLENTQYNVNRQQADIQLLEWGKTYEKTETHYQEKTYIACIATGKVQPENWSNSNTNNYTFQHLKGYVEKMLGTYKLSLRNFQAQESTSSLLEYGLTYYKGNVPVITIGKVKKSILKKFGLEKKEVFYSECLWDFLHKLTNTKNTYKEVSKYPSVRRDLALVVDKSITFEQIEKIIYKQEKKLVKEVGLFDIYEGKNIPDTKKSYAISIVLQEENQTLTDEIVEKSIQNILHTIAKETAAVLR